MIEQLGFGAALDAFYMFAIVWRYAGRIEARGHLVDIEARSLIALLVGDERGEIVGRRYVRVTSGEVLCSVTVRRANGTFSKFSPAGPGSAIAG
jgi:hypothetical protein